MVGFRGLLLCLQLALLTVVLRTATHLCDPRTVEEKYMHPIGILADLQGPKQRCGQFETSVELTTGQLFRFDLDARPGNETRVQLPHPEILGALSVGSTLLLDDGKLRMRVVRHGGSAAKDSLFAECQVEVGGRLSSNKGCQHARYLVAHSRQSP